MFEDETKIDEVKLSTRFVPEKREEYQEVHGYRRDVEIVRNGKTFADLISQVYPSAEIPENNSSDLSEDKIQADSPKNMTKDDIMKKVDKSHLNSLMEIHHQSTRMIEAVRLGYHSLPELQAFTNNKDRDQARNVLNKLVSSGRLERRVKNGEIFYFFPVSPVLNSDGGDNISADRDISAPSSDAAKERAPSDDCRSEKASQSKSQVDDKEIEVKMENDHENFVSIKIPVEFFEKMQESFFLASEAIKILLESASR